MNLKEYLEEEGIKIAAFAKKLGVTPPTLYSIFARDADIRLSLALKIEKLTKGKVKCKDLASKSTD